MIRPPAQIAQLFVRQSGKIRSRSLLVLDNVDPNLRLAQQRSIWVTFGLGCVDPNPFWSGRVRSQSFLILDGDDQNMLLARQGSISVTSFPLKHRSWLGKGRSRSLLVSNGVDANLGSAGFDLGHF